MRPLALALAGGLALTSCGKANDNWSLNRAIDDSAVTAGSIADRLNGESITNENIDQAYFEIDGTVLKLQKLCRAQISDALNETEHNISDAIFTFERAGETFPIKATLINNSGPLDGHNSSVIQFDFGPEEIGTTSAVIDARFPGRIYPLSDADFKRFLESLFGEKPDFTCIEKGL